MLIASLHAIGSAWLVTSGVTPLFVVLLIVIKTAKVMLVQSFLEQSAKRRLAKVALKCGDQQYTYSEL